MDVPHVYVHALTLGCFHSLISTPNLLGGVLTAWADSCMEVKSASSVASLNLPEFGGRCRKVMLGVWVLGCQSPKQFQPITTPQLIFCVKPPKRDCHGFLTSWSHRVWHGWLKSQVQNWCRFESPVQQDFFLPKSAFSADSLTVSVCTAPECNCMHQHLCAC